MEKIHFILHLLMGIVVAFLSTRHWIITEKMSSIDRPIECSTAIGDSQAELTTDNDQSTLERDVDGGGDNSSRSFSSVWCSGQDQVDRICQFHNLYYIPDEDQFAFLHGEKSIYVGLPDDRFDPALLDLSSVRDHNRNHFNYVDMLSSKASHLIANAHVIHERSSIFSRFHPSNLMHVLHDDLLPLFHTLMTSEARRVADGAQEFHRDRRFPVQLVFMDRANPGPFKDLYELFSSLKPLYGQDLIRFGKPLCFADVVVGISKHTTWYQYGFLKAQGPLEDLKVNAWDIRRFGRFVKRHLNIKESNEGELFGDTIVLLTRKSNRLILNEFNLTMSLSRAFHKKVVTMAMETHSLTDLIKVISAASMLIGMHGSLLSLALFLPPGAMLIELFPYAVNPEQYTPYRTLVGLRGMHVRYVAWRNLYVEKSVAHVDRGWDQGGIAHLSSEDQRRILASDDVPRHLCCRDPEWLFRIYQDTVVDTDGLIELIRLKQGEQSSPSESLSLSSVQRHRIFPSYVTDISCFGSASNSLSIDWKPPRNLEFIGYETIRYEVWIQEDGSSDYMAWILSTTSHLFSSSGLKPQTKYHIWIRCLMDDDQTGPFKSPNVTCSTGSL